MQPALLLAAILLSGALAGCSGLILTGDELAAPGPASYVLVANYFKGTFKDYSTFAAVELADFRKVHTVKGWNWITCMRFVDHDRARTFAIFINGGAVAESRYAVKTDECDLQAYAPFDLASGTFRAVSPPAPEPAPSGLSANPGALAVGPSALDPLH